MSHASTQQVILFPACLRLLLLFLHEPQSQVPTNLHFCQEHWFPSAEFSATAVIFYEVSSSHALTFDVTMSTLSCRPRFLEIKYKWLPTSQTNRKMNVIRIRFEKKTTGRYTSIAVIGRVRPSVESAASALPFKEVYIRRWKWITLIDIATALHFISKKVKPTTITQNTMIFNRFTFTAAMAASAASAISVQRRAAITVSFAPST